MMVKSAFSIEMSENLMKMSFWWKNRDSGERACRSGWKSRWGFVRGSRKWTEEEKWWMLIIELESKGAWVKMQKVQKHTWSSKKCLCHQNMNWYQIKIHNMPKDPHRSVLWTDQEITWIVCRWQEYIHIWRERCYFPELLKLGKIATWIAMPWNCPRQSSPGSEHSHSGIER